LPSSGWSVGTGGKTRYRDLHLSNGPIRIVDVASGKLRIGGKGGQLVHSLATDPEPVRVVLTSGATRWCFEFGGATKVRAGRLFSARGAAAPGACAD
jgi:hypothetical protein